MKIIKTPPVFIVGCPRSGTTLLSDLLKFTKYGSPVETHFITKYFKKLKKYQPLSERKKFVRLVKRIINERPIRQWKIDFNIDLMWERFKEGGSSSYAELVNIICMERFSKFGKISWGDKTPHYILDLDILYTLFPDSKYIYIVRDGRDVALSLLRKKWGPNNVYTCALYWKNCNKKFEIIKKIKSKENLFELRYEDLLSSPKEIIIDLYNFLEEEISLKQVDSLCEKIKKDNFYKWKKHMTSKQILIFESVARDILCYYNYPLVNRKSDLHINFVEREFYRIHDLIKKFVYLFELNIIDGFKIKFFGKEPFAE